MIRFAKRALLALLATTFGAASASAVTYQPGDLFLGFRASGGAGSTKDYVVNLGQASQFTGATAPLTLTNLGNLNADLAAATLYGADWTTRGDLFWGIAGTVGQFAAVGADPAKTTYATRARTVKSNQTQPYRRDSDTGQGITTSKINSMANAYASGTATANSSAAIIQNDTSINSWSSFQPGGDNAGPQPGISFQAYNPTIEGKFSATEGTSASLLDLYRIVPSSQGGNAEYVGFFTISADGAVTFVPKTSPAITFESSVYSVSEAAQGGQVVLNVVRLGDASGTSTVNVSTSNGTAIAGTDFTGLSNAQVTFGPNETSKQVAIAITDRQSYQGPRSFTVTLSGATDGTFIPPTTATVNIGETSPEPAGVISFSSATYNVAPLNGSGQPNSVEVTVTRANPTDASVSVTVAVTGGTLSNGTDFTFTSPATLSFGPNEASQTVTIPLNAIDASKLPGTITLALSNPTDGATLGGQTTAAVNVANVGTLQFSAASYQGAENAAGDSIVTVTVTRTGGTSGAVSVEVALGTGSTATAGSDYTATLPTTLSWANNDASAKTFDVVIKSDSNNSEGAETLRLALQNATGATIGAQGTTTVNILDADVAGPTLTITSPAPNAKLSAGSVTIAGVATDNQGVGRVEVRIDGGAAIVLTPVNATASFNYSTTVTPEPGSHFVQVVAYDLVGNATSILTRSFTFTNVRPNLAGSYNGLIEAAGNLSAPLDYNGILAVTVTSAGSFTGKVTFSGLTVPVQGTFGTDGVARITKAGNATALPVVKPGKPDATFIGFLSLSIDGATKKVTGTLRNGTDANATMLAQIDADQATYSKTNKVPTTIVDPTKEKGKYTALFRAQAAPNNGTAATGFPQGDGYGTLTVSDTGAVSISGKLADGSPFSYKNTLAGTNEWPVFIPLYGNKGYITGNVKFDPAQSTTDASGANFRWIKPAGLAGQKNYPAGWPKGIFVDFAASKYQAPTSSTTALGANRNAPVAVDIALSDIVATPGAAGTTQNATGSVAANGQITVTGSAVSLKANFINATGALSGSFTHPANSKTVTLQGVAFQKTNTAHGYFVDSQTSGTQQSGGIDISVD